MIGTRILKIDLEIAEIIEVKIASVRGNMYCTGTVSRLYKNYTHKTFYTFGCKSSPITCNVSSPVSLLVRKWNKVPRKAQ